LTFILLWDIIGYNKERKMKEIKYNNKTIKIPAYFANNIDSKQALNMTTCTNPYSNESCELPDFAATIYYNIKDAEWAKQYKIMQQGITWFQKYFTKQYFVLLD
jgi:hypothetical protein